MEALLGRGVAGCSLETSDGCGFKGLGRGGWVCSRPGLTPRGSASISSDRSPVGPLARPSCAAAPPKKTLSPRPGTGHDLALASQRKSVLRKLQFSAGSTCGPRRGKGLGAA